MATSRLRFRTDRLNELREQHGLSQQALATAAGIDQGNLSRILAGKQTPNLITALGLATALGAELRDICQVTEEVAA